MTTTLLGDVVVTVALMRAAGACYDDEELQRVLGEGVPARDVLDLAIPAEDRIWAVLHSGALDARALRLFACWCAERVLPRYESRYPVAALGAQ